MFEVIQLSTFKQFGSWLYFSVEEHTWYSFCKNSYAKEAKKALEKSDGPL